MDSFFIFYFFIPQTTTFHFIYRPISLSYLYHIFIISLSYLYHIFIISLLLWILVVCGFYLLFIILIYNILFYISQHSLYHILPYLYHISPFMDSCSLWISFIIYYFNLQYSILYLAT